jgi:hypothetical protein
MEFLAAAGQRLNKFPASNTFSGWQRGQQFVWNF